LDPSGDGLGYSSSTSGVRVRLTGWEPSVLHRYNSQLPSRLVS
jgi:hypothetical protein